MDEKPSSDDEPTGTAVLILTHEHPKQLGFLLDAISGLGGHHFIHVDGKTSILPFQEVVGDQPRTYFCSNRVSVNWAGFSVVEATLSALKQARSFGNFRRYVLLSGTCFPCRPLEQIRRLLETDFEYLDARPIERGDQDLYFRISRYHLIDHPLLNNKTRQTMQGPEPQVHRYISEFKASLPPPPTFPLTYYYGQQFWALTYTAVEMIWAFWSDPTNAPLIQRFRYSFCPDESFFQTILCNSPLQIQRRGALHYVDWSPESKARGKILGDEHFEKIMRSGKSFARKFHPTESQGLRQQLASI